ncbi:hypothetical protein QPK87_12175 [Kamptonema cortianum]|nr:hypothetical protein [Oscillatoria laete-virens]MDK3157327.1 hypothetical protein [Kamptonema cortianum]MDL5054915.1 hypothetical protein [Oscillatoria laete-virens NRMC-F 0139]
MKRKKTDLYTERQTVSLTPEQMRRLKELRSVRARKDGRLIHITDLIRDAVNYYLAAQEDLPGSRRAIAKGVEAKVEALDTKIEALTAKLDGFIERVTRRRGQ